MLAGGGGLIISRKKNAPRIGHGLPPLLRKVKKYIYHLAFKKFTNELPLTKSSSPFSKLPSLFPIRNIRSVCSLSLPYLILLVILSLSPLEMLSLLDFPKTTSSYLLQFTGLSFSSSVWTPLHLPHLYT